MDLIKKKIALQNSYIIETEQIKLAITEKGGHMAPVFFYNDSGKPIQPYFINPWYRESKAPKGNVLEILRGDFFCMPFGGINKYGNEDHPAQGETASSVWLPVNYRKKGNLTQFIAEISTNIRPGKVTKTVNLVDGENVVYLNHYLEKYEGPMCLGHHAILRIPEGGDGFRISSSPIKFGMVPEQNGTVYNDGRYFSLLPGSMFVDPTKIPTVWIHNPFTNIFKFPDREGFTDVTGLYSLTEDDCIFPTWTTAVSTSAEYLWFSLKDSRILPQLLIWTSNKGNYNFPWNGRTVCLGLEDSCGYFSSGLTQSIQTNPVNSKGIKTFHSLERDKPLSVNYIEGVVRIGKGYTKTVDVKFEPNRLTFISENGEEISHKACWEFITSGKIDFKQAI